MPLSIVQLRRADFIEDHPTFAPFVPDFPTFMRKTRKWVDCQDMGLRGCFMANEDFEAEEGEPEAEAGEYLHHSNPRELEPVTGNTDTIDAVGNHIEKYLGPIKLVWHEIVSLGVHVDLYWVEATSERPYHTIVTSGMSDVSMKVPDSLDDPDAWKYAELLVSLPPEWPLAEGAFRKADGSENTENYWPLRMLKDLARMPHEYDTWLGPGHTVTNGDPPEPFSEKAKFDSSLIFPSLLTADDFDSCDTNDGRKINFYGVYPLYAEEREFKVRKGADALYAKLLGEFNVTELIDFDRPNTCRKKKFGLF